MKFDIRRKREAGFTLLEVQVAMMMTGLFLSASLQMMLASKMIQVKASKRYSIMEWIRKDRAIAELVGKNTDKFAGVPCGEYGRALRERINPTARSGVEETLTLPQEFKERIEMKDVLLKRTMTDVTVNNNPYKPDLDGLMLKYRAVLMPGEKEIGTPVFERVIPDALYSCYKD